MLSYLRDRPLTLLRFPDGVSGQRFFQKHWSDSLPPFVKTVRLFSEHNQAARLPTSCGGSTRE